MILQAFFLVFDLYADPTLSHNSKSNTVSITSVACGKHIEWLTVCFHFK